LPACPGLLAGGEPRSMPSTANSPAVLLKKPTERRLATLSASLEIRPCKLTLTDSRRGRRRLRDVPSQRWRRAASSNMILSCYDSVHLVPATPACEMSG
jgi:hypothetical protein